MRQRTHSSILLGLAVVIVGCRDFSPGALAGSEHSAGRESVTPALPSKDLLALGARLFEDVNLSRDSTISCATCHMPGRAFTEPRAVSHGIGIRARKRNTQSLINVAVARASFDWDGRATTLADQLRGVFAVTGDMGIDLGEAVARVRVDTSYTTEFYRVFGRPPDVDGLLASLGRFQESLVVTESRFDRFYFGDDSTALSASEVRGWHLFRTARAGCSGCHTAVPEPGGSGVIIFTDLRFHNLGVGYENGRMEDVGRYVVTRRPSAWGAFMTPSLRNVSLTAPYMHDGSLSTLEDVVEFYEKGGIKNPQIDEIIVRRQFTRQERADLVAFLGSLTTEWLADSAAVRKRLLRHLDDRTHE